MLRKVPAAYGTRINEVLLAALGMTLTRWAGGDRVLVDLEGHGREDLPGAEVDLSRTVGWFTSLHPVSVELPASRQPDEIMAAAKTWTRSAPYGGIGYGLLGHGESGAQIVFNYHGQVSGSEDTGEPDELTVARSGRCARSHLLEISAAVAGGQLRVSWLYSEKSHAEATVRQLADDYLAHLRLLISHCAGKKSELENVLAECDVPGVSVAVFAQGRIEAWQAGPGLRATTAFQCGSVSKHVATVAALAAGLELDEDVTRHLRSWKLLDTDGAPAGATLRQLLTHTAGLTPGWYEGYDRDAAWPSLVDVLNGHGNTPEVRVQPDQVGMFRYSGSHFLVVQQVLTDLTGESFADLARRLVFEPLGMRHTTFDHEHPFTADVNIPAPISQSA